jgi:hypothetical protein
MQFLLWVVHTTQANVLEGNNSLHFPGSLPNVNWGMVYESITKNYTQVLSRLVCFQEKYNLNLTHTAT